MKNILQSLNIRFAILYNNNRSSFIFLFVLLGLALTDFFFYYIINSTLLKFDVRIQKLLLHDPNIISFAPEAWLGLLGLVLGTLIIVISVASQSTPKLIDLYADDVTSLLYVWYIVNCSVYNMYLQFYYEVEQKSYHKISSIILNTYIYLPIALLLAVPYVLYILRYTKTSNVIQKIYSDNIRRMQRLANRSQLELLEDKRTIAEYQSELFESLNQLDDLLQYTPFKEPKGDIINKISALIQKYITIKKELNESFFKISHRIKDDVSFKTMTGQFEEMELSRTFYEQKGFRLLGNAYQKLMEDEQFDLASVCAYELSECGRFAIDYKDEPLIEVAMIRFNTLLRFGIKHGLKNSEARNLYNAIFHYSEFIIHIVKTKNQNLISKSCRYLNIYVNEIFNHSRKDPVFIFLVDVFTWEFKRILIELNKNALPLELQKEILGLFLKIDDLSETSVQQGAKAFTFGVRSLQISLALYYLSIQNESELSLQNNQELAKRIISDIIQDHLDMSKEELKSKVKGTCDRLLSAGQRFWEDTDRGNSNMYYSYEKDFIPEFLRIFELSVGRN